MTSELTPYVKACDDLTLIELVKATSILSRRYKKNSRSTSSSLEVKKKCSVLAKKNRDRHKRYVEEVSRRLSVYSPQQRKDLTRALEIYGISGCLKAFGGQG